MTRFWMENVGRLAVVALCFHLGDTAGDATVSTGRSLEVTQPRALPAADTVGGDQRVAPLGPFSGPDPEERELIIPDGQP